jgi:hypothetical protein
MGLLLGLTSLIHAEEAPAPEKIRDTLLRSKTRKLETT